MTYFKAVRPDGTDFYTGTVQWAPEQGEIPEGGIIVTHPTSTEWGEDHSTHLCASEAPTNCTGFKWPGRLLEVEPVGEVHPHYNSKWSALVWRVVRELPAVDALGPQGEAVGALLDGLRRLNAAGRAALASVGDDAGLDARAVAWGAALSTARDAALYAARGAALKAARGVAGSAPGDAASALVVWDLITPAHRTALTEPIRTALPDLWAEVTAYLPLTS